MDQFEPTTPRENPRQVWMDAVNTFKQFAEPILTAPDKGIAGNTADVLGTAVKGGVSAFLSPFTTTAGLLKDFGKDVISGTAGLLGKRAPEWTKGGMWDKRIAQTERYGPITSGALGAAEGALKGSAVAAAGAMAGGAYKAWEGAGKPMGGYVEEIQRLRVRDPKASVKELMQDHADYHRQLGTSGENPGMSQYHDELAGRIAKDMKLPKPVLEEDYEQLFDAAAKKYGVDLKDMPRGKGPFRESPGATIEKTPAQRQAEYYWNNKRTYNINDQWKAYKESVIKDLRQAGIDEQTVDSIRAASTPKAISGFSQRLSKIKGLPDQAPEILSAWQEETKIAADAFKTLKTGGALSEVQSPVLEMQKSLFASTRPSGVNAGVADTLRETAELYAERGDVGRATAYNRAADLITRKGAPKLDALAPQGQKALMEAYAGQGGIGKNMSDHIVDILDHGSFDELDALRFRSTPSFPGPGAAGGTAPMDMTAAERAAAEKTAATDYALRFKEPPIPFKRPGTPGSIGTGEQPFLSPDDFNNVSGDIPENITPESAKAAAMADATGSRARLSTIADYQRVIRDALAAGKKEIAAFLQKQMIDRFGSPKK